MKNKGSLLASFLCFYCSLIIAAGAAERPAMAQALEQLHEQNFAISAPWQAILQVRSDAPINPNYRGYLSQPFSLTGELDATVNAIYRTPRQACQYPARKRLLEHALGLTVGALSLVPCPDYQQYRQKVPADDLYLVFAAENVTSASSMMGHIMLRFDGQNDQQIPVQHGITFFTQLDTLNIPQLMLDTLVWGKPGIFQVAPYAPIARHYRQVEQRNVWEYRLQADALARDIIRDMVWELGRFQPDYFFATYNCASVTQLLLALAAPHQIAATDRLATPADVVRFARTHQLIAEARLLPATKWQVQALHPMLDAHIRADLTRQVLDGQMPAWAATPDAQDFVAYEYARSLNQLAFQRGRITPETYRTNQQHLQHQAERFAHLALDVTQYKNPANNNKEALLAVGWDTGYGADALTLRYFPVANPMFADNRNFNGETSLILGDTQISWIPAQQRVLLDHLMVYQMHSRVTYNPLWGDVSSGLEVGLDRVFDRSLARQLVARAEASAGFSQALGETMLFYAEAGIGLAADDEQIRPYLKPRLGGYWYLGRQTKLQLEVASAVNQYDRDPVTQWSLQASHFVAQDWTLTWQVSRVAGSEQFTRYQAQLNYQF